MQPDHNDYSCLCSEPQRPFDKKTLIDDLKRVIYNLKQDKIIKNNITFYSRLLAQVQRKQWNQKMFGNE